ncbi:MAG: hypothetical protein ACFFF4_10840 [Candidatus Thorarchaeota archaeon]
MSLENRIYIDCYDANGLYEENYSRIMMVMQALTNSNLVKRDWVSSQAVGGSWARSIRCVFDTDADTHDIKRLMLGLEYCELDSVPEELHQMNRSELFRFADIDVITASAKSGIASRLKLREKKISSGEVRNGESDMEFIVTCRKNLLDSLSDEDQEKLLKSEKEIFDKLVNSIPK